mmetsp:Transcript_137019/g.263353  ORF Transcript_137019/g.263353 Transcript_137019/m.263353 type:complete len:247 (-) Transcript_137019:97-837(-)
MGLFGRATAICLLITSGLTAKNKTSDDEKAVKQMRVCFELASFRAKAHANVVQKIMKAAIDAAKEEEGEGLTSELALNTLMLGWMTKCYENVEAVGAELVAAASSENITLYRELEDRLLGALPDKKKEVSTDLVMEAMAFIMTQPKKLLKLAKKIMKEPVKKAAKNSTAIGSNKTETKIPEVTPKSSRFGASATMAAVLAVLGAFAAAIAALRKLSRKGGSSPGKATSGKAKEQRAEKKSGKRKSN